MIYMLFSQDPFFVIDNNCKHRQHHLYIALHASYLFTDIFKVFPFFILSSCLLSFTSLFLTLFKYKSILCTHNISPSFFYIVRLISTSLARDTILGTKYFRVRVRILCLSVCLSVPFSLSFQQLLTLISKQQ